MRQAVPSFPMAGPKKEDDKAQRAAKPDEKAKRAEKKDDEAQRETKKDDSKKAARAGKKDEKAKRETKKDDSKKAARAGKKDEKARRETKKDDSKKAARAKQDDKAKRETKKDDSKKAARAEKKDDKAKREKDDTKKAARAAKKDDEAKREASKDEMAKRDTIAADGAPSGDSGMAPAGFEGALGRATQSGGEPLSAPVRQHMESGYGHSFEGVRIYRDSSAASLADSIGARAFTLGSNVFFGAGQYQPHTPDGRRLIAHEVAHVVQNSDGRTAQPTLWRNGTPPQGQTTTGTPPGQTGQAPPAGQTAPPAGPPRFTGAAGKAITKEAADGKVGTYELPALKVPTVEGGVKGASNHPNAILQGVPAAGKSAMVTGQPWEFTGRTARGSTSARQTWIKAAVADATLQDALKNQVQTRFGGGGAAAAPSGGTAAPAGNTPAPLAQGTSQVYYLRPDRSGAAPYFIVGTGEQVATHDFIVLPIWNKQKAPQSYDVDHLMELQLGGLDGWSNFWVLDASANRSSGSKINSELTKDIDALTEEAKRGDATGDFWVAARGGNKPTAKDVLASWKIRFASFTNLDIAGDKTVFWTRSEVQAGDHLAGLRAMTEQEIAAAGLRFEPGTQPTFINVFPGPQGGFFKRLDRQGQNWVPPAAGLYEGFDNVAVQITPFDSVQDGRKVGTITGRAFFESSKNGKLYDAPGITLDLLQSTSLGFGLYVDRRPLNQALHALHMKQASPVEIDDSGISATGALFVEGRIIVSLPLFPGTEIPFNITGNTITLSFPIPTDKLRLGPVRVTDASLDMGVNADGLVLGGGVGFAVDGIGQGRLEARAGVPVGAQQEAPAAAAATGDQPAPSGPGFALIGSFTFESDKLDPATITVGYANHQFTVDAVVGLARGAVRGIESSEIHVRSAPEGLSINGFAVLGVPPLQGTRLTVGRDAQGAIEIAAENVPLPVGGIPGVRGATASVRIARNPDTGDWTLSGGGSADIGVGGFTGQLVVDINGPFVTIAGRNLTLQRGPLQGSGNFQVTNRPLDPAGNPVEGGEPGAMAASGHVEASMPLGSFLTATLGGTFLPNGELTFTGGVRLPPTVNLFDRREFNRELFRPPSLDIPIFGISAAGQRIGIFATIGGSLSFNAGIGPGQLRNAALTAEFNPDHPENTTVAGHAEFFVPANAGLRLEINGGIGAGIPIVSAEAGIVIGGELGIQADASAQVDVSWTPQAGLDVNAVARVNAQPQFTFDINAYLRIAADVVITEFELYSRRWNLVSFRFGPQLAIGAEMPIHWSERGGLDFDVNRITIHRPEIDFSQMGNDLISHLTGGAP
jgi:hypothetical protein